MSVLMQLLGTIISAVLPAIERALARPRKVSKRVSYMSEDRDRFDRLKRARDRFTGVKL